MPNEEEEGCGLQALVDLRRLDPELLWNGNPSTLTNQTKLTVSGANCSEISISNLFRQLGDMPRESEQVAVTPVPLSEAGRLDAYLHNDCSRSSIRGRYGKRRRHQQE